MRSGGRQLAEPDVLLHGPAVSWPGRAMSTRWPVAGKSRAMPSVHHRHMHTRFVDGLTIRRCGTATPLRSPRSSSASATALASGASAGRSRGCPSSSSQASPASTRDHHVLVGYVDGDPEPVGIARLVRTGSSAEIAFAIADTHQSTRNRLDPRERARRRRTGRGDHRSSWQRSAATTRGCWRSSSASAPSALTWRGGERELVIGLEH